MAQQTTPPEKPRRINWLVPLGGMLAFLVAFVLPAVRWFRAGGAKLVEPQALTQSSGIERNPAFSPDGQSLIYASNETLYIQRLGGSPAAFQKGTRAMYSPDGSRIAYAGDAGIRIVATAGGTALSIAPDGKDPAWSPDGKRIVYATADGLREISPEGGQSARLDGVTGAPSVPAYGPDARRIGYLAREGEKPPVLYELDLETKKTARLGPTETFAYCSGDNAIYMLQTSNGQTGVFRLARSDKQPQWVMQLAGKGDARDLAVSRDCLRIAYAAVTPDGKSRIYVAGLPGRK